MSTAVVSGQRIDAGEISGILTLRPCIYPVELQHIRPSDRDYVASEINAFLLAWLTSQSCRVVNRPTPLCLAGPNWAPIQWTHAAAKVGIPVQSMWHHVPEMGESKIQDRIEEVVTVGQHCFGYSDSVFQTWTLRLAQATGVDLLCCRFSLERRCLVSAHTWPDLRDPDLLAILFDQLEGRE